MFSRITVSLVVGLAFLLATVRLPAAPCMVTTVASGKACQPDCCANKTCCATAHERTQPPVQPLLKPSSDQQNVATLAATAVPAICIQRVSESRVVSSRAFSGHAPAPFALICIRLI